MPTMPSTRTDRPCPACVLFNRVYNNSAQYCALRGSTTAQHITRTERSPYPPCVFLKSTARLVEFTDRVQVCLQSIDIHLSLVQQQMVQDAAEQSEPVRKLHKPPINHIIARIDWMTLVSEGDSSNTRGSPCLRGQRASRNLVPLRAVAFNSGRTRVSSIDAVLTVLDQHCWVM
jgi:hypothetical protein